MHRWRKSFVSDVNDEEEESLSDMERRMRLFVLRSKVLALKTQVNSLVQQQVATAEFRHRMEQVMRRRRKKQQQNKRLYSQEKR